MPTLYMMVGLPGSGKSYWVESQVGPQDAIVSTDAVIERVVEFCGFSTYSESFKDLIGFATKASESYLKDAIQKQLDIYWDQTNLDSHVRIRKLKMVASTYKKIAVVMNTDPVVISERLNSRKAWKDIPSYVIEDMKKRFTFPTLSEGFDQIIAISRTTIEKETDPWTQS